MPDQNSENTTRADQQKLIQGTFDWDKAEASASPPGQPDSQASAEVTALGQRATLLPNLLPGIVPASDFHRILHSDQLYTKLEVELPVEYLQKVIDPLTVRQNRIPTQGTLSDREWGFRGGRSYFNETVEFDTLIRIATDIGPVALLDHVQRKHNQMNSPTHSDNKFRQRVYSRRGDRSVIESTERLFTTSVDALPGSFRNIDLTTVRKADTRKNLPEHIAVGTIEGPVHPKEAALKALIEHSPHLKNGGVVLVIVNDAATRDYLACKCNNMKGVHRAVSSTAAARELLTNSEGSFTAENNEVSVVVLNQSTGQKQLETVRKNMPTAYAALTVIYNTDVNQKTAEPVLNPIKQPDIVTKQAVELIRPGQKVANKERLLKLEQPLDDQGSRTEPPDNWWD